MMIVLHSTPDELTHNVFICYIVSSLINGFDLEPQYCGKLHLYFDIGARLFGKIFTIDCVWTVHIFTGKWQNLIIEQNFNIDNFTHHNKSSIFDHTVELLQLITFLNYLDVLKNIGKYTNSVTYLILLEWMIINRNINCNATQCSLITNEILKQWTIRLDIHWRLLNPFFYT